MARPNASSHYKRSHIVLIPGFGGFDALGQVEYYAGVTPVFEKWTAGEPDIALHYFDNFPTASVVTRATRLRRYLAQRIARGEIAPGDEVSLVGHSTGGLDIRWLIWELAGNDERTKSEGHPKPIRVDGGSAVHPGDLLGRIHRVVFLSVPHWGTNIADWVRSYRVWREAVVAELRVAVAGSQAFVLDQIEEWAAGAAAHLTDANVLLAVQDAVTEANERNGDRSAIRTAAAHEAASELALYLRQIASNFHAIDDLTSEPPPSGPPSPAHFDNDERRKELDLWESHKIESLSFATLGNRPFRFSPGKPAPVWEFSKLRTCPEVAKDVELSEGTDIAYRLCYRACAGGPFRKPCLSGTETGRLGNCPPPPLELWDNDGIVNTASMLWPLSENIVVAGDHLDIVGHYHLLKAEPGGGRNYQAYDTLRSTPPFSHDMFTRIWTEIFDFCSGHKGGRHQARKKIGRRVAVATVSGKKGA